MCLIYIDSGRHSWQKKSDFHQLADHAVGFPADNFLSEYLDGRGWPLLLCLWSQKQQQFNPHVCE